MKPYELYNELIANPFAPKKYRDLAKFYEESGRPNDAEAFLFALATKFETAAHEHDHTHPDKE